MGLIIDVHNTDQFDSLFSPPLCMVPQAVQAIFEAVVNPTANLSANVEGTIPAREQ